MEKLLTKQEQKIDPCGLRSGLRSILFNFIFRKSEYKFLLVIFLYGEHATVSPMTASQHPIICRPTAVCVCVCVCLSHALSKKKDILKMDCYS